MGSTPASLLGLNQRRDPPAGAFPKGALAQVVGQSFQVREPLMLEVEAFRAAARRHTRDAWRVSG